MGYLKPPSLPFSERRQFRKALLWTVQVLFAAGVLTISSRSASAEIYEVTTTADTEIAGDGFRSLREAIVAANSNPGQDTIMFNIPNIGLGFPHIIFVGSGNPFGMPLPFITDKVIIDGTSQPGYDRNAGVPVVVLDGLNVIFPVLADAGAEYKDGFHLRTDPPVESDPPTYSAIRGFGIRNFPDRAINLYSSFHMIDRNVIQQNGAGILGSVSQGNKILLNTIADNDGVGISVIFNSGEPGYDPGAETRISGNVISGNGQQGVFSNADNTIISLNMICDNDGDGVFISGTYRSDVFLNWIGTGSDDACEFGNGGNGLVVTGAPRSFEGIKTRILGNVISGNGANGVWLDGTSTTVVKGNFIGLHPSGAAVPNALHGIYITDSGSGNLIGGPDQVSIPLPPITQVIPGPNTIAFNEGDGVFVESGSGNAIRSNSIFNNGGLGIDLGRDGVSANDGSNNFDDPLDIDEGPNHLQNFPALQGAHASANGTVINGKRFAKVSTTLQIDFYISDALDPSGHGEGRKHFASLSYNVPPNPGGFVFFLPEKASPGSYITATATSSDGSTSEFSNGVLVTGRRR